MTAPRLYTDLAHLWPLLSPPEDYEPEADVVRRVLDDRLGPAPHGRRWAILELGAGGGHSLVHLKRVFDCTASDLSPHMLANSRRLNPDLDHVVGDMRSLRLDRRFDAVLIHDAIDYMTSRADLRAALDTAAAHLRAGGVLLVAPTEMKETFVEGQTASDCHADETCELSYVSCARVPDPTDETIEHTMTLLIRRRDDADADCWRLSVETDCDTLGLFDRATWRSTILAAGFGVAREPEGATRDDGEEAPFELWVGVKR